MQKDRTQLNEKKTKRKRTHGVLTVVMKNWEPFVFTPAFAIDKRNGCECFTSKFSSKKSSCLDVIIKVMYYKMKKKQTIKFWTVNGFSTCTVTVRKISTLNHELCARACVWVGGGGR